jgi:hypothetical protein
MPNFIGGDIIEAHCNHPELGDFRYYPKSGEAFTLDKGGIRSADDANGVTSAGDMIDKLNRVRWSLEGPIAVDMVSENETESLNAMAAHPLPGVWTLSHISGAISKGKGKPVGDLQNDTNEATMTLKVSGGGKLEKI